MLTFLRSAAGTFIAKILLGLLILSFAIWGVTGASFNLSGNTIASVGSSEIKVIDFQREFLGEINRMSEQFGQRITPQQALQFGIDRQVLSRMINQATLDDRARAYGMGVSHDKISAEILNDPTFTGADGKFDPSRYQWLLQNAGISEATFLKSQKNTYLRQQVIDTFIAGVPVPKAIESAIARHFNEERTVDYIEIDIRDIAPVTAPDDATLQSFFEKEKATYRAPEYRSLTLLPISAKDFGGTGDVSDEEVRAIYEQNKARYIVPETRKIRRISFDTPQKARAASDKIKAGQTFDALVSEIGLASEDVDLGTLRRDQMIDRKLADAAFALPLQTASDVIDGDFTRAIVYVDAINGGETRSLDVVADEIRQDIAAEKNNQKLVERYDAIEDARAAGNTFAEIAEKFSLKLMTIKDVSETGSLLAGGELDVSTPGRDRLLQDAFRTDVGVENDVIEVNRNGFVWFEVTEIKPSRERILEEVKATVTEDWIRLEIQKAVDARAEALLKELQSGKSLETMASELGRAVSQASGIKRNQPVDGLSGAAVQQIFQGPKGHKASAPGDLPNQAFLIVVKDVAAGATVLPKEQADNLRTSLQNDLIETYITQTRETVGTSINAGALEQATNLDGSSRNQ